MGRHQTTDPRAMPLGEYIAEVMQIITAQPASGEINVERVKMLRLAAESGKFDETFKGFNDAMMLRQQ